MSKRTIGMALVWALALAVIVGCGGKASNGDGAGDSGDATTDAATTEETTDAFADETADETADAGDDGGFSISGDGFEFNAGDSGITIRSEDGDVSLQFGDDATIPDNFPEDAPVYDGLVITGAASGALGQEGFSVTGQTPDPVAKVAEALKVAAEGEGWKEEMVMSQGSDTRMMSYSKDGRALNYVISKSDDQTSVHITVAAD